MTAVMIADDEAKAKDVLGDCAWLCFPESDPLVEAAARFQERFGGEPACVVFLDGYAYLGPVEEER